MLSIYFYEFTTSARIRAFKSANLIKNTMNNNEKALASSHFVGGPAINRQDFLSAESQILLQEAVEPMSGDAEPAADGSETDGGIEPDFFPVQQLGKVCEIIFGCEHSDYVFFYKCAICKQ